MANRALAWKLKDPWTLEAQVGKIAFARAGKRSHYVTEDETKELLNGDAESAEARARQALEADQADTQARVLLGAALRQQKRYQEARAVLGEMGKYVFEVAPDANKIQIKHAIEEVFSNKKVQVLSVNIVRVPGKERRRGRSVGMTRSWKKAIVTLRAGQRLDLFEGV